MIYSIRGLPKHVIVTIFANIAGVDVRSVLASRLDAIVTTKTIVADSGVVEPCWRPHRRLMTVAAIVTRLNMIGGLSGRDYAVVARTTTPGDRRVIDKCNRTPGCRCMTVCTHSRCHYVVGRFLRGTYEALRRMTSHANRAGSFENSSCMTSLAGDASMSAIEWKSRTEVVK